MSGDGMAASRAAFTAARSRSNTQLFFAVFAKNDRITCVTLVDSHLGHATLRRPWTDIVSARLKCLPHLSH
jgi:hypothetical protein